MLARHMAGYAPSLMVTSFFAFLSVTLFTSLMSQAEYGQYALTITSMTMLIGVGFFWLQSAASRLLPQAVAEGREEKFLSTLYGLFLVCSLPLLIIGVVLGRFYQLGDLQVAGLFAAPLTVLRAFLNLNQSVHRNHIRITRYNIIEIGQSVIGFTAAFGLVAVGHYGASGGAMGLLLGLAALSLFDWRMLGFVKRRDFDKGMARDIVRFGAPFIITYGLSFILASSDRYLIDYFLGSDQVGIYSAAYAFPDRIGQNLFMAVATASFPLVVRRLEQEGVEAARDQTHTNGVALLALAFPACIGLLLVNRLIAETLIGPAFREGAIQIMPIITVAMVFNGVAAHYFDHAFHLAKKTQLFFFTLGPAALVNFIGNLYAIPRFGIIGAAYTTLAAYIVYLALSILIGRRVFAVRFPVKRALQIAMSTTVMAAALLSFNVPENLWGLAIKILVGGCVYSLCLAVFDVMGIRQKIMRRLGKPQTAPSALVCSVLTSIATIAAIADEWRDLHRRAGSPVFSDYGWFDIWWRHLGLAQKQNVAVFIARSSSGELQAVLPFGLYGRSGLRMGEWMGSDVFDYGDILASSPEAAHVLWQFAMRKGGYDILRLGSVHEKSLVAPLLTSAKPHQVNANYFVSLEGLNGETWLASQSRKLRGDTRRKMEKMQAEGTVAFHVYKNTDALPVPIMDALYAQKRAWFDERHTTGIFTYPEMKAFLSELAQDAAHQGRLYLAWLSCGDKIVACHQGFLRDGVLHLYLTTYDAAFAAYSPGNGLMIETIKWAAGNGYREVDFMRGDESYKQRFATGTRMLSTFILGRSLVGKSLLALRKAFQKRD